jgi:hypothetical protein
VNLRGSIGEIILPKRPAHPGIHDPPDAHHGRDQKERKNEMIKLTKKQAIQYKQRWRQIKAIETWELQTTPMPLKFKQLCWLMNSFRLSRPDEQREREIDTIRKRWITLRKNGRS